MNALIYSVLAGLLFAGGVYLLMERHITRLVAGLILLNQGVNLALLLSGGLIRGGAPVVEEASAPLHEMADPLPQALILTAIVITFALVAFAVVVYRHLHLATGIEDVECEEDER